MLFREEQSPMANRSFLLRLKRWPRNISCLSWLREPSSVQLIFYLFVSLSSVFRGHVFVGRGTGYLVSLIFFAFDKA